MAVYCVNDYDFFTYSPVIPNLECMKILSYLKKKNHIAVLSNEVEKFNQGFIRKDYDDGYYPDYFFKEGFSYGGRAFSPDHYIPLSTEVEEAIPDVLAYEPFAYRFGATHKEKENFSKILRAAHCRLSLDGETLARDPFKNHDFNYRSSGIIFHDYDIAKVKDSHLLLEKVSKSRILKTGDMLPLPIGNKFPINIYTDEDLDKWRAVLPMTNFLYFKLNGIQSNGAIVEMCSLNRKLATQTIYNVTYDSIDENDFLKNKIFQLYKQVLFFKTNKIKILLKDEKNILKTTEAKQLIDLWNCYLSAALQLEEFNMENRTTLYKFCTSKKAEQLTRVNFKSTVLKKEDMKKIFHLIRTVNYDTFDLFYQWEKVEYKGGDFVNAWAGNTQNN